MKTREALRDYLRERGIIEDGATPAQWYSDPWFRWHARGRRIPFWPMIGFRRGIVAHDLHHLVAGYETDLRGEVALAGWELGSGGCGWRVMFWLDRLIIAGVSLLFAPRRLLRAFRRGLGQRNLYRLRPEEVLEMDLEEVRGLCAGSRAARGAGTGR